MQENALKTKSVQGNERERKNCNGVKWCNKEHKRVQWNAMKK